jgi:hypothetical protein
MLGIVSGWHSCEGLRFVNEDVQLLIGQIFDHISYC